MKRKIFYIVHLDKERLFILSLVSASIIFLSFLTGYRLGIMRTQEEEILIPTPQSHFPSVAEPEQKEEKPAIDSKTEVSDTQMKSEKKSLKSGNQNSETAKAKLNQKETVSFTELKQAEAIHLQPEQAGENITSSEISYDANAEWKEYNEPFKVKNQQAETKEKKVASKQENYYIQIVALKNPEDVKGTIEYLKDNGINTQSKKKNKLYVVYTTAKSEAEMLKIKQKLQHLNFKDILIKRQ